MDRIEFLKWLIAESPSTTQQLMAWLQRAKRYPPEKKYRIKAGLNLFLNYAANLIRGTM